MKKIKKDKVVHLYSAFCICVCLKALYNDRFTPSGAEAYRAPLAADSKRSMYAGTHFIDPGGMDS